MKPLSVATLRYLLLSAVLAAPALADAQITASGGGTSSMKSGTGSSTGLGSGGRGAMPSMSNAPSSGAGSSFGSAGRGMGGMSNSAGAQHGSPSAATSKKSASLPKKLKSAQGAARPSDKYADYNWGAASSYDTKGLYTPKWTSPEDNYDWGATPQ